MPPKTKSATRTKFFQQDIVRSISEPNVLGVIQRCWHDAEDIPADPALHAENSILRPLKRGEFGVSFLSGTSDRRIVHESTLELVDRTLQPGDICKRSIDDMQSAIVLGVSVKGKLAHAFTAKPLDGWWSLSDLEGSLDPDIGDYVEFADWIGQVVEVFDDAVILTPSGEQTFYEVGSSLHVGDAITSPLGYQSHTMMELQNHPAESGMNYPTGYAGIGPHEGALDAPDVSPVLPSTDELPKGVVVSVKHIMYAISWLALNQTLDQSIAEKKKRPPKFWFGEGLQSLTLIRGLSDLEMRVGDRVKLKVPVLDPPSDDALPRSQENLFCVKETTTTLRVIWQDGTEESLLSRDVIPYINPDEYDVWPGDYVEWKDDEKNRIAIVQSVNAEQRTAQILLPDTNTTQLAPVLELDAQGGHSHDHLDTFGVTIGDFVFIHRPNTTNGLPLPRVPKIGEIEEWVRERPDEEGGLPAWKIEFGETGASVSTLRRLGTIKDFAMQTPTDDRLNWIGEVSRLNKDGTVVVTHPNFTSATYPMNRLTRLYDGIEQLEDGLWDDPGSEMSGDDANPDEQRWTMDELGLWRLDNAPDENAGEWEDMSDGADEAEVQSLVRGFEMEVTYDDDRGDAMSVIDDDRMSILEPEINSEPLAVDAKARSPSPVPSTSHEREQIPWKTFDILPAAPVDHAFYGTVPGQRARNFFSRLQKEYRVLSSSLPDSIVVRAYEDRTDLLRTLIIGPENTPYEDAPFVIDWMLDSNFPQSPPIAHFLSWTNGNGRVNPNLYEEGKVCLSILGTWSGDKMEIWSAARSSLLQAFVSIQGLVLVKEPWFCEPAYEKLRGTEEGTVNSRLYNETAYILARGFVRRALELPLGSLQDELKMFYIEHGKLAKVVRDAERLIAKSASTKTKEGAVSVEEEDSDLAVPRLTAGGVIMLDRTLTKLKALLASLAPASESAAGAGK